MTLSPTEIDEICEKEIETRSIKMTSEMLKSFCYEGEVNGETIRMITPFNCGDFTYATNGRITIRIPLQKEYNNNHGMATEGVEHFFNTDLSGDYWMDIPSDFTVPDIIECQCCDGKGKINGVICDECDGKGGWEETTPMKIKQMKVSNVILAKLFRLPDVKIWIHPDMKYNDPIPFKFNEGNGVFMGMKGDEMTPAEIIAELEWVTTRYDEMRRLRSPDVLNVLYCRVKALKERLKQEAEK